MMEGTYPVLNNIVILGPHVVDSNVTHRNIVCKDLPYA